MLRRLAFASFLLAAMMSTQPALADRSPECDRANAARRVHIACTKECTKAYKEWLMSDVDHGGAAFLKAKQQRLTCFNNCPSDPNSECPYYDP